MSYLSPRFPTPADQKVSLYKYIEHPLMLFEGVLKVRGALVGMLPLQDIKGCVVNAGLNTI